MELNLIEGISGTDLDGNPIYNYHYENPKTGDIYEEERVENQYSSWSDEQRSGGPGSSLGWAVKPYDSKPGKLIATGAALKNPDIQNFLNGYNIRGLVNPAIKYSDPREAQRIYELKQSNPNQYYSQIAEDLASQASANSSMNKGEHNVAFTNQLNQIKEINPAAYYKGQFDILGESIGWQIGQNRSDRNPATFEKIQKLIPEAMAAGVSMDEINSIVNTNANFANFTNQQRIANEAASGGSGFNLSEVVRGVLPIAAFAIGAPFLDAALAGGAAAAAGGGAAGGTATGTGLTGGFGGSTGLLGGTGAAGFGGAGSAAGIAGTQAAAGLGVATGSALPALGMATGGFPSTVGSLSAALPAQGSVGGAGLGLSAELAPGAILGSGLPGGGAIGASYALGANGIPATNLLGQPIPASSVGFGSIPNTVTSGLSIGINDALNAARLGKGLIGGQQQPTPQGAAPMPQSIMPRGQVDYSGILNLLQVPSPQRNMYSLLG
jgi:hypothetical protein